MIDWRFPSNDYGENKGINDSGVAMFRGTPLKSLAREICQNSLDASAGGKITVQFNAFKVKTADIPGKEYLVDTYNRCMSFWETQKAKATKEFFSDAIKCISEDECCVLRISDFNTTGLTGSRGEINTDWTNLTKSSGSSDKKGTAGGSYGIGKFAPFACSALSMVFYSTYDINEERAYQGVTRLVTFTRSDGQNTQGTGYYGEEKNTPVYEEIKLDPSFERKDGQYGTDVFIIGYKYGGDEWEKDIIKSLLDSFLGAFWNEKLEVIIGDVVINKDTLEEIIEEYRDDLSGNAYKYYKVLSSDETIWVDNDFNGMGNIRLGILMGVQDAVNKIAMIRQTGMKIMDKDRLSGHVPFMGVMFINGDEINKKLRDIENPEHTKWEPDRSSHPNVAKQLLKSLNEFVREEIEKLINAGTGDSVDAAGVGTFLPDEPDDTSEKTKEEIVSDKVINVDIKKAKQKSTSQSVPGEHDSVSKEKEQVHMEPGGKEEEWFHPGGHTTNPDTIPGQPAHVEPGGKRQAPKKINVRAEKFVCMCISRKDGKYMLRVTPDRDGDEGVIELFLSAETQRYPAPIKNVTLIGGTVSNENNRIKNLSFVKGEEMKFSLEIDYTEYCSMEVEMYATSK